jgi:hypothetical protein
VYLLISAEVKSTLNSGGYRESELSKSSEFSPEILFQSTKKVYDVVLIVVLTASVFFPRTLFLSCSMCPLVLSFHSIFVSKFSLLSVVKVIAKGMTFQDAASKMRRALTEFRKITISSMNVVTAGG